MIRQQISGYYTAECINFDKLDYLPTLGQDMKRKVIADDPMAAHTNMNDELNAANLATTIWIIPVMSCEIPNTVKPAKNKAVD